MSQCCKTNAFGVIVINVKIKKKWTPKNKKFENPSTIHKFYICWFRSKKIFGSKRSYYWKYGLWEGGRGSKLIVQGTDSYPVNEWTCHLSPCFWLGNLFCIGIESDPSRLTRLTRIDEVEYTAYTEYSEVIIHVCIGLKNVQYLKKKELALIK